MNAMVATVLAYVVVTGLLWGFAGTLLLQAWRRR
jgi:hypothetical protein